MAGTKNGGENQPYDEHSSANHLSFLLLKGLSRFRKTRRMLCILFVGMYYYVLQKTKPSAQVYIFA